MLFVDRLLLVGVVVWCFCWSGTKEQTGRKEIGWGVVFMSSLSMCVCDEKGQESSIGNKGRFIRWEDCRVVEFAGAAWCGCRPGYVVKLEIGVLLN